MESKYASRGGEKLEFGLEYFGINVRGKVCADFGASTGGFTDCLLEHGAKKVYALETGYGLLDWKLRNDPRVAVMERTNAMHARLPEKADFISIDVSWTRQKNIMPAALGNLKAGGNIVSLLKPHYEAPKAWLKKGKLAENESGLVISAVRSDLAGQGVEIAEIIESPIKGKKGANTEYLIWIKTNPRYPGQAPDN